MQREIEMADHHHDHPEYETLGAFAGYGECDGPQPRYFAAECYAGCTDRHCPYIHSSGWQIDGVEGLFKTAEEARASNAKTGE